MIPTNPNALREANRARVMGAVRQHGPVSRAGIARLTGLTPAAIGDIVAGLMADGYLKESSATLKGPAARRSILLELNADHAFAVGVNVGVTRVAAVRVDLTGQIRSRFSCRLSATRRTAVLDHIQEAVEAVSAGVPGEALLGVGVGLHGVVDAETGVSRFAPHFGARNWPVRAELEQRLGLSVAVENGVRAMTLGEHWFGAAPDVDNFACVAVGQGIGAGIFLNGRIYRGELGIAGEVGHITVDANGARCACGNYGCLETVASGPAIARRALTLIKQGRASRIAELVTDLESVTAETVGLAAAQGDSLATHVLEEAGTYLGMAIANLANTLGLRYIVIGGGVARAGEPLLRVVRETAARRVLGLTDTPIEVVPAALGYDAAPLGAASIVLDHFFVHGRAPVPAS